MPALRKLDLIDFIPDSEGKSTLRTFQGRRVVVDDKETAQAGSQDGTVYATVLSSEGAFAHGAIAGIELKPLCFHEHPILQPPFSAVAG
jgi:hypothetical protein